jgi:transcriptional regulator GlxA family with amidase domain
VLAPDARAALESIRPGTRMVSICTGAFVLAAAGLLDGRRVTTHWKFADALRRLHPTVRVDEKVLFVDDGDVLTSAGLAAGIDLCLHIIRSDHGAQVANAVAKYCVVPPWRRVGRLSSSTGPCRRQTTPRRPPPASGHWATSMRS